VPQPLPSIPAGFGLPFYYSSLTNFEVLYLVDAAAPRKFLHGTHLELATFNGKACVSFNHQLYTGQFPTGASVTQEVELNILAVPKELLPLVAEVSFDQFVSGDEQTKFMGNHRVWVPCDADVAIKAGKELFGEPKFKTSFTISIPSLNDPSVTTWSVICNDPASPTTAGSYIFSCQADLTGLPATASNPSPVTEYGKHQDRLIGCRWNILGTFDTYKLDANSAKRVKLSFGTSSHKMRADMQELIGSTPAAYARSYQSVPAAIQSRAYFPVTKG
jgi:hypothetical protein